MMYAADQDVLGGMNLCMAVVDEVMSLTAKDDIKIITEKYAEAVQEYPDNWSELTIATIHRIVDQHSAIPDQAKRELLFFLGLSAELLDEVGA